MIDELSSQMGIRYQIKPAVYNRLVDGSQSVELATVQRLAADGTITEEEEGAYIRLMAKSEINHTFHGLKSLFKIILFRLRWHYHKQVGKLRHRHAHHPVEDPDTRRRFQSQIQHVFRLTIRKVNAYLNEVQTPQNAHEVSLVRRTYLNRYRLFNQKEPLNDEQVNRLFTTAFQLEHTYIQQEAAAGRMSSALASALNQQVSTDEMAYMLSMD